MSDHNGHVCLYGQEADLLRPATRLHHLSRRLAGRGRRFTLEGRLSAAAVLHIAAAVYTPSQLDPDGRDPAANASRTPVPEGIQLHVTP